MIVVREISVAEAESVRVLAAYRDGTTDRFTKTALGILLRDEVRHAAVGRQLESLMRTRYGEGLLAETIARSDVAREADVRALRAVYDESARGGPGRAFGASLVLADMAP